MNENNDTALTEHNAENIHWIEILAIKKKVLQKFEDTLSTEIFSNKETKALQEKIKNLVNEMEDLRTTLKKREAWLRKKPKTLAGKNNTKNLEQIVTVIEGIKNISKEFLDIEYEYKKLLSE